MELTASDRMERAFQEWLSPLECHHRRLWGRPMYFVNRHLFAYINEEQVVLRLPTESVEALLGSRRRAQAFEASDGRVCKQLVVLPFQRREDPMKSFWLRELLHESYRFVAGLPEPRPVDRLGKQPDLCAEFDELALNPDNRTAFYLW